MPTWQTPPWCFQLLHIFIFNGGCKEGEKKGGEERGRGERGKKGVQREKRARREKRWERGRVGKKGGEGGKMEARWREECGKRRPPMYFVCLVQVTFQKKAAFREDTNDFAEHLQIKLRTGRRTSTPYRVPEISYITKNVSKNYYRAGLKRVNGKGGYSHLFASAAECIVSPHGWSSSRTDT